jgi:hypothetical protein
VQWCDLLGSPSNSANSTCHGPLLRRAPVFICIIYVFKDKSRIIYVFIFAFWVFFGGIGI